MPLLYGFSNFLCTILYRVVKFRIGVIRSNLKLAFPEKSETERLAIEKAFYRHMCDMIVESIKYFTISKKEAEKNFSINNATLLKDLYKKGKSVVIVGGHYASWERYALNATREVPHYTAALYTPLTDKFLNKKMLESRSKFGLHMVSVKETHNLFELSYKKPIAVIFGSDQSPSNPDKAYWMTFLNQETGIQYGAEKYARLYNCAVVYGQLDKEPRGAESITYRLICEDPKDLPEGAITKAFTHMLEEKIKDKPEFWLWSHRRWKHKRPSNMPLN